jgi:hypothetical protein
MSCRDGIEQKARVSSMNPEFESTREAHRLALAWAERVGLAR